MTNGPFQTMNGIVDALRQQPFMLAMVLLNFGLLGYLYYEGVQAHHERQIDTQLLYENRKYVADLLAKCYPAPPEQH